MSWDGRGRADTRTLVFLHEVYELYSLVLLHWHGLRCYDHEMKGYHGVEIPCHHTQREKLARPSDHIH